MNFQVPIQLEIEDKFVQAIIDLDTGFIGFTEKVDDQEIEYYYGESPVEFKKALLKRLEPLFGERITTNFKISSKNETMKFISKYLREKADNIR